MQSCGEQVNAILDLTGWTQTRLVHELRRAALALGEAAPAGLNPVTINRWKQGRQSPSGYYRRLLRHVYVTTGQSIIGSRFSNRATGSLSVQQSSEAKSMKRRQFIAYSAALAGTTVLDPAQWAAISARRLRPDDQLIDGLQSVIENHASRWFTTAPSTLLPAVRGELGVLSELRNAPHADAIHRRLVALTGQAASLAGWISWLGGNEQAADAYYMFASSAATEVNDRQLHAFVLVGRSFMASDLFRAARTGGSEALSLLDRAVEMAGPSAPPHLRVWALSRRAEELASAHGRGAGPAIVADLDLAERLLVSVSARHRGFFGYWDDARLLGCRGTCSVLVSESDAAVRMLSDALAATPPHLTEERSVLLADLAAAYAQQGEVEGSCEALQRALVLGAPNDTNRIGRVVGVRRERLAAWDDSAAVKQFDDRLREILDSDAGILYLV
jgi:tetratricopeptide (TPR) repeat protein